MRLAAGKVNNVGPGFQVKWPAFPADSDLTDCPPHAKDSHVEILGRFGIGWVAGSNRSRHAGDCFSMKAAAMNGRCATLALGGGGARGIAHLGAIEELLKAGFSVERIVGVS